MELQASTKNAGHLMKQWGNSLPGQRVSIDTETSEAALIEPLHEPAHARIRELIAKQGERLVEAREVFPNIHLPTWLYWAARLRDSGLCRVTVGSLGTIDQIKAQHGQPKLRTFAPAEGDQKVDRLIAVLFSFLSDKQKAEASKLLSVA